ncbi:hypothetical protein WMF18_35210 [Sorangium sp. So ce315]|uniref:hypothetical protein n=1 Tax=Sorangium sp. So ce315 TaxID=3133299 RepID=UPI003F647E28
MQAPEILAAPIDPAPTRVPAPDQPGPAPAPATAPQPPPLAASPSAPASRPDPDDRPARGEGRNEGLQQAVRDVRDVLDRALSPEDEEALVDMDGTALATLLERLTRGRRWPLP